MNAQQHPVTLCMTSIIATLSILPVPSHQSKGLSPVFNIHNAIRQSSQCIAKYLSTFHIDMNISIIRDEAMGCYEWLNWYMPHLHQHHHTEDDYWFPVWRKVLIDAGVPTSDVNAVFDRWESDHESIDRYEHEMTHDLQLLSNIRDDITRDELQQALVAAQRSTQAFASFIHNHLQSEEEYWVDQFITHDRITQQHAEQLDATFVNTKLSKMKMKEAGDTMGFIFTPLNKQQEQAIVKSMLPFPVRWYYNWIARPSYLKRAPKLYLIAHGHLAA